MNQKIEKFTAYLDAALTRCIEQEKTLIADDRKDEAIFEKIRANVYNIFRTVLGVAVDTCGEDTKKIRDFFLKRIDLIPVSWHASYDAAKQHNDTAKVQIEEIKLAVVQEIKAEFAKIWEEHS